MKEKDVQRVLEAAYDAVALATVGQSTTPLGQALTALNFALIKADPHKVYQRKPLHIDAANAQTGEELEPKLRACPRLPKLIGEREAGTHD